MSEENCYWIGEFDATELCAASNLPALPEYWVRWDSGDDIDGTPAARSYATGGLYPNGRGPSTVKVAASPGINGIIVMAAYYPYGDFVNSYSMATYASQYSSDHGATYSGVEEYRTWQQGSVYGGYDARNATWLDRRMYMGTNIDYDGSRFVLVNDIGNNQGGSPTNDCDIVTAITTDGQNWTVNTATNQTISVQRTASYDGDIWYLSENDWQSQYGGEALWFIMAHSGNDGVSWTFTDIGQDNIPPGTGHVFNPSEPKDTFSAISANATGCHITGESYDYPTGDYGWFYYRPLTNTTYAAPYLLWDGSSGNTATPWNCDILACRVNSSSLILSAKMGSSSNKVYLKRSTDGGQIWSAEQEIITLNDGAPYYENFFVNHCGNGIHLVELSDGRLVLVILYDAEYPGYTNDAGGTFDNWAAWTAYSVSEDQGVTWSALTLVSPWFVYEDVFESQRFEVCAKGIDVVVTTTSRMDGGFNLIFRPTSTPSAEYLVPPAMTLPSAPTTGWP